MYRVVGEHSGRRRRCGASHAGASGKENVGMSNDNACMTMRTASPRSPGQRQTYQGKPGTKDNPRGDSDDDAVNIPQPAAQAMA